MTVSTLERKLVIAIKSHQCVWCGHAVLAGSTYERQKIIIDGSFQSNAWHEACLVGFDDHWKETREEEFEPCEHDMPFFALYQLETANPPPETRAVCDLSDTELLDELRNRRHRFSPDKYMSQDQCDDRAKLGVLRSAIVDLWKQDPTDPALSILHSKCDELDSIYGNPLPARAFAVNTTLPGRNHETHQSDMST